MSHSEFLRSIKGGRTDHGVRLEYANWLATLGHSGAEYLRAELALNNLPAEGPDTARARERLWRAWGNADPTWLALVTQPSILLANPTPFPAAWWATDIGDLRSCDRTYCNYAYESLPDLHVENLRGEFQWLPPVSSEVVLKRYAHWPPEMRERVRQNNVSTIENEARFPNDFRRFMLDEQRHFSLNSPTQCSVTPSSLIPDEHGGLYATFFIDSQYALLWDLYIGPTGSHCVIAGPPDEEEFDGHGNLVRRPPRERWFVAPTFETFLYRVWMESNAWYYVHADLCARKNWPIPALTPELEQYLAHYEMERKGDKG